MERFVLTFSMAAAIWMVAAWTAWAAEGSASVRPPAVAGSWYPGDEQDLRKLLERFFEAAKQPQLPGEPVAIIVPHAGYRFSGAIAARAFKTIKGKDFSRVILLGPSHHMGAAFLGGAIPTVGQFGTPLGNVPLDTAVCEKLIACDGFVGDDRPHAREHCLEIELPFLQSVLRDFRIVPVLIGRSDEATLVKLASAIRSVLDERTLIVVSTDFTHYGATYRYVPFKENVQANIARLDGAAIDRILAVDRRGFVDFVQHTGATICGRWPVAVALEALADRPNLEGVVLAYATSGAMLKDWTNSVSYAAIALCRGAAAPLTGPEQEVLLRLARDQLREHLRHGRQLTDVEGKYALTPRLTKPGAAFVTLTRGGRLRGCVGHVVPVEPLHMSVLHNTINACKDRRFVGDPITAAEEPNLHVEISVLSRYKQIGGVDEIKLGRDGLILRKGRNQGLLLPQVPGQQNWDLPEYLEGLTRKAGLAPGAWKDPDARIYRFTAQVFGEPEPATGPAPTPGPGR